MFSHGMALLPRKNMQCSGLRATHEIATLVDEYLTLKPNGKSKVIAMVTKKIPQGFCTKCKNLKFVNFIFFELFKI